MFSDASVECATNFFGWNYPYIAIDGPDGCGKTTLLGWVIEYLERHTDLNIRRYKEPCELFLSGTTIRKHLNGEIDLTEENLGSLFRDNRLNLWNHEIKPFLKISHNNVVFTDRCLLSSFVYQFSQFIEGQIPFKEIAHFNRKVKRPYLTVIVGADELVTGNMLNSRGDNDRYDNDKILGIKSHYAYRFYYELIKAHVTIDGHSLWPSDSKIIWYDNTKNLLHGSQNGITEEFKRECVEDFIRTLFRG